MASTGVLGARLQTQREAALEQLNNLAEQLGLEIDLPSIVDFAKAKSAHQPALLEEANMKLVLAQNVVINALLERVNSKTSGAKK
jgi:hypothetical protein